jgi:hypothetical protein
MAVKTRSVSCVDAPTHAVNNNARLVGFIVIQSDARLLNSNAFAAGESPERQSCNCISFIPAKWEKCRSCV